MTDAAKIAARLDELEKYFDGDIGVGTFDDLIAIARAALARWIAEERLLANITEVRGHSLMEVQNARNEVNAALSKLAEGR